MSIEKAFGALKRRFAALKHGLRLRRSEHNCLLILAAIVLHNLCIEFNDDIFDQEIEDEQENFQNVQGVKMTITMANC